MKEKNIIVKVLTLVIILMFSIVGNVYAEDTTSTKMQIIKAGDAWTNISILDSYTECESLNALESTLGTKSLKAHLTTDYDWSAMAILSISQYGATTTNSPGTTSTTKNSSGIYGIGSNFTQTTTITSNYTGTIIYDENGKIKKYINLINPETGVEYTNDKTETGRKAIAYVSRAEGGTKGWFGAYAGVQNSTSIPLGIKMGMFAVICGKANYYNCNGSYGGGYSNVTFRPVIWN